MGINSLQQAAFRAFLLLSTATLLGLTSCIEQGVPQAVKTALENIQRDYAPDRRVAIFDIKLHLQNDTLIISGETNLPEAHEALLRQLRDLDLNYSDQIRILPSPVLAGQIRGVVNVSVANIRSAPKHSTELATQSILGTGLKVYKKEGDWYYVQTPDHYLGWMDGGALALMDEQQYAEWLQTEKVIVLADYGFVLDAASAQAARLGDLVAGNILADGGAEEGAFRTVVYPDGRRGFVNGSAVSSLSDWLEGKREPSAPAIIQTAMTYMGRPYLWGGTSGKGMDCSGFTKTVYFMNGIVLPRDASQQVQAGVPIATDSSLQNLLPGDFLFFGEAATDSQKEKVRHVGLYLGDGRFIHSGADNPGVRIESLLPGTAGFAPHRLETFLRARRMESGSPGVVRIAELPDFYGDLQ